MITTDVAGGVTAMLLSAPEHLQSPEMTNQKNRLTRPTRLLLIGPMINEAPPYTDVIGGAVVLFAETARQLSQRGFDLDILSTWRTRTNVPGWRARINDLATFMVTIWGVLIKVRRSQLVFLNMSTFSALTFVAPLVWLICRVGRRPLVLKFFGGRFQRVYEAYNPIVRLLTDRTFMRSDIIYVEARQTLKSFPTQRNFRWHPNTRDVRFAHTGRRHCIRKLIFIGQLRMAKGLFEALEACRSLPAGCHLSVYGPEMSDTDFSLFEGHPRATYCGVVEPADVPSVIGEHDLLLFPSYLMGEGYPGVIIEAFQCGVPVIASCLPSIQEIVRHEENGLLVEPRSVTDLETAVMHLLENPDLYQKLVEEAKQTGEYFRSGPWYDRMAADLEEVAQTTDKHW